MSLFTHTEESEIEGGYTSLVLVDLKEFSVRCLSP